MVETKRKSLIFLSLAFVLAVIAAGLVLNELREAQEAIGETVSVAVAKENINSYTQLSESGIEWKEVPKTEQSGAFISGKSALDNQITLVDIEKGDFITKNILRSKINIPLDNRVVWLNATENVVIDQDVKSGDLVDIVVTYKKEKELITERILENVPVVQKSDSQKDSKRTGSNIKVSLSIEDSEQLIYYQNSAEQIRALRINQITEELKDNKGSEPVEKAEEKQKAEPKDEESKQKDTDKKKKEKEKKASDEKKNE